MRVRFAPSPTGHLHVGNARTALFNWLLARRFGGVFILRIEDTDAERSSGASEHAILDDLRWLNLAWDEGVEAAGEHGPYRQSERLPVYREHARQLLARQQAYFCFCSPAKLDADRRDALAAGKPVVYPGTCRALDPDHARTRVESGEAAAIRFHVGDGPPVSFVDLVRGEVTFAREMIGDAVIVRADGWPAYNFSVVVDDHLMAITHVVRGEDHVSNTPRQQLLYDAFGWPAPRFAHLSLVLGPDHAPLSKRHGATSVAEFRSKGYLPEALANYLALLGWSPGDELELLPLPEMASRFDLAAVSHSAAVFDEAKLAWVNRHYLKTLSPDRLVRDAQPRLRDAGFLLGNPSPDAWAWLTEVLPPAAAVVDTLNEIPARLRTVFSFDPAAIVAEPALRNELSDAGARAVVTALADDLRNAAPMVDRDQFRAAAGRVRARTGAKGRALFHPMRVCLTGEADGPELDLLVPAIERGAALPPGSGLAPIRSCRERAEAVATALRSSEFRVGSAERATEDGSAE